MTASPSLATIGYEGASLNAVVAALTAAGIRHLVDVRELPLSRRPGFSKSPLAAALAAAGVEYRHMRALGTPKEGRVAAKEGRRQDFWAVVERQLATTAAETALEEVARLASEAPTCLLCMEADPGLCHRLAVAERLAARRGFAIRHLHPVPP